MKRTLFGRAIACSLVLVLTVAAMNAYAEQPGHAAFAKGGAAIAAALNPKATTATPTVAENLLPPSPPATPPPAPAAEGGKQRTTMIWVGIGVTAVIAGYLIHRSYVNHGHIF